MDHHGSHSETSTGTGNTTPSRYSLVYIGSNQNAADETADSETEAVRFTSEDFHKKLILEKFASIEDVQKKLVENINSIKAEYGVLLFLYSVLLTKVSNNNTSLRTCTKKELVHPHRNVLKSVL